MILDQVFRITVPGRWQEAWLYKDALLAWDRSNVLHRMPIKQLQKQIGAVAGTEFGPLFEIALFRNDWKVSEQFTRLVGLRSVQTALRSTLAQSFPAEAAIQLKPDAQPLPIEPPPGVILDADIYGNRVYVGSTVGTFETRYNPEYAGDRQHTEQILGQRTTSVTAKYMALNVSAGDSGLWFKPIVFGSGAEFERSSRISDDDDLRHVADISESSAFAYQNLLNYDGGPIPQFMRSQARKTRSHPNQQYAQYVVDGYDRTENIEGLTRSAVRGTQLRLDGDAADKDTADKEEIEVLGNAGHRLLVASGDLIRVLDIDSRKPKTEIKIDKEFGASEIILPKNDVLATYHLGSNFVVESYDQVSLVTPSGVSRLYGGEVVNLRTFEDARRFKEVTILITEESLEIIGFI